MKAIKINETNMKAIKINEFMGGPFGMGMMGPPVVEEMMHALGIRPEFPETKEEYRDFDISKVLNGRAKEMFDDPMDPEDQEDIKELYFYYKGLQKFFGD